uniref:Uncharacterized protein n=1 Tax=Trichogramma kaykai TaxID=54128 RepID=A0ABD2W4T0_9HYME
MKRYTHDMNTLGDTRRDKKKRFDSSVSYCCTIVRNARQVLQVAAPTTSFISLNLNFHVEEQLCDGSSGLTRLRFCLLLLL